jgi:hypothetical protein
MAARRLTFPPTSLTERSARRVLACGLAGEPRLGSNAWLYDEEVITMLRDRETISAAADDGRGCHDLTLGRPGAWFEQFRDTRVPTGPGREWTIPGWQTGRKLRVDNPLASMGDWAP